MAEARKAVSELDKAVTKLEAEKTKLGEKRKVAVEAAAARAAKRFDDRIAVIDSQLAGLRRVG